MLLARCDAFGGVDWAENGTQPAMVESAGLYLEWNMREKVSLGKLARFLAGLRCRAGRETWGNARSGKCETSEMRCGFTVWCCLGCFGMFGRMSSE